MLAMQKQLWSPINVTWIVGYGVVFGLNQFQPPDAHIGIRPLTFFRWHRNLDCLLLHGTY
uniref:Uncharacterized protein n=1 Tax=Triticum urartu TaxID=4572 RepID=A0A8R7Q0N1_TRIUA